MSDEQDGDEQDEAFYRKYIGRLCYDSSLGESEEAIAVSLTLITDVFKNVYANRWKYLTYDIKHDTVQTSSCVLFHSDCGAVVWL